MTDPQLATIEEVFATDPTWPPDTVVPINLTGTTGYLVVQLFNFYAAEATWDVSYWSDGATGPLWAGVGGWVDFSARVRGLSWSRGAESPLDRPRVGTATLHFDNRDAEMSSWFENSAFTTRGDGGAGPPWIQPGVFIRIGSFWDDEFGPTWLPHFSGRIEVLDEDTAENVDGWLQVTAAELTTDLGGYNGPEQSPAGAGDTLDQRVARLLADAGWPFGYVVDSDPVGDAATYQATTMAQNRLAELYLTGDSAGMRVLGGADGKLRVTVPFTPYSTPGEQVFSNEPGADVPLSRIKPYASLDRCVNVAIAARAGSIEQTVRDEGSVSLRGVQNPSGSRDDLIVETDAMVVAMLDRKVALGKDDVVGIEAIEIDVDMHPELPYILANFAAAGLEDLTPFNVRWVHPSGNEYVVSAYITGMQHDIVPFDAGVPLKWTATLSLAKRIVIDPAYWDVGVWDIGVWT